MEQTNREAHTPRLLILLASDGAQSTISPTRPR